MAVDRGLFIRRLLGDIDGNRTSELELDFVVRLRRVLSVLQLHQRARRRRVSVGFGMMKIQRKEKMIGLVIP